MSFILRQHETNLPPRRLAARAFFMVLVALAIWATTADVWAAKTLWEFTPYRVQVIVAAERDAALPDHFGEDLAQQLLQRAEAVVGSPWEIESQAAPAVLDYAVRQRFDQLQFEDIPRSVPEFDKVLLVRVARHVQGHEVAVRELDVRTRQFGTVMRRIVAQPFLLPEVAFETALAAFAPLAQVDSVAQKKAEIRLRAAALPTRDPSLKVVTQGEVYRPIIRFNGADGGVRGITVLPWTYLSVEHEAESPPAKPADPKSKAPAAPSPVRPLVGGPIACRIHSGLRSPLTSRRRGRIEQLAVAVHPPQQPTRLEVASITEPTYALAGYEVHAHRPDSPTTQLLGYTDAQGALTIAPDSAHPLRLLILKNGGQPLARLPVVPGVEPVAKALIPNDEQRLRVEGFITGLQEQMVDVVARRQLFMALIRARLQAGKLAEAEDLYKRLQALPNIEEFRGTLSDFERGVITNDARLRKRIDQLFTDTRKVLDTHMLAKPVEELASQLGAAKVAGK
jgi:hypothetical protein